MLDHHQDFKNFIYIIIFINICNFDLIIQYYFKTIFLDIISPPHMELGLAIGDELVPGSFLSKIIFLSCIYFYFQKYKKLLFIDVFIYFFNCYYFNK